LTVLLLTDNLQTILMYWWACRLRVRAPFTENSNIYFTQLLPYKFKTLHTYITRTEKNRDIQGCLFLFYVLASSYEEEYKMTAINGNGR